MGRGCAITLQCVLCNREIVETRDHIMRDCRYVKTFWQGLLMNFGLTVNRQSDQTMVRSWFTQAKEGKEWDVVWAAGHWALWRERNRRIFHNNVSRSLQ